jgi:hypothetical protein
MHEKQDVYDVRTRSSSFSIMWTLHRRLLSPELREKDSRRFAAAESGHPAIYSFRNDAHSLSMQTDRPRSNRGTLPGGWRETGGSKLKALATTIH